MKRELQITSDGSHTLWVPQLNATYHSTFGAIGESEHVFIQAGLRHLLLTGRFEEKSLVRVFEMGFGTGLNALLSYREIREKQQGLYYQAVELYPLPPEEVSGLNYASLLHHQPLSSFFASLHAAPWNEDVAIEDSFTLHKSDVSIADIQITQPFHLVYFDAFAPDVQPELWTAAVFQKMYDSLYDGGALVTYCSKGAVRRTLQSVGFTVEKLKGPPGKREIIRAVKKG